MESHIFVIINISLSIKVTWNRKDFTEHALLSRMNALFSMTTTKSWTMYDPVILDLCFLLSFTISVFTLIKKHLNNKRQSLFLPKFLLLNYMDNAHLMKHENQHPINLQDSSIFCGPVSTMILKVCIQNLCWATPLG